MLLTNIDGEKRGLFIIGDSTSAQLYMHGISQFFHCNKNDTSALIIPEDYWNYHNTGLLCDHPIVSKIGYMGHFGVAHSDYFPAMPSHRFKGDTNDSVENILLVTKEFKQRSVGLSGIDLIFLSNYWDAGRMLILINSKRSTFSNLINSFRANYTGVVEMIQGQLSSSDRLYLEVPHSIEKEFKHYVTFINLEIMRIASEKKLPLFREDLSLGILSEQGRESYLEDGVHQKQKYNPQITQYLHNLLYSP